MDHALRVRLSVSLRLAVTSRFTRRARHALNREWGGRWCFGHHMLLGPPHGALHVLALVNNGAPFTDGKSVTPAQVTSINIKDESVDLDYIGQVVCALAGVANSAWPA